MRILHLTALALLGACASSGAPGEAPLDVDFEVEPDELAAGDSITLELENDSPGPISYNLCSSGLEREAGGAWQEVPDGRICTRELRILAPGEEARFRLRLPETLEPGVYRFRTGVQLQEADPGTQLPSETFRVRS